MLKRVRIVLTALLLLAAVGVNAQVTTASMAGKVTDASNEPIIGATVQAVHQPSGSRYGTVTNVDGRYSIQGMRTGGPYRVEISYIGYQTVVYKDITLQLGEVYNLNVEMSESSELLNEVIVTTAKTKFTAEKTGATTNISSAQMTQLPTVNRSISDIARLSPYANGMSFAGGDGRSTNFTIDGANFNNNFGLSSNLPGGSNPISMDAIEEVQVVVAPFDVRQTNFIGGGSMLLPRVVRTRSEVLPIPITATRTCAVTASTARTWEHVPTSPRLPTASRWAVLSSRTNCSSS